VRRDLRVFHFTLDETAAVVRARFEQLGADAEIVGDRLTVDTSDDICADYIIDRVGEAHGPAFVVVDYLQLLDQRRSNPELSAQVQALSAFARAAGSIVVAISQIHRSFESTGKSLPQLSDVRLPNPLDLSLFTKACFMHQGQVRFEDLA
jgi:hypothetical protein